MRFQATLAVITFFIASAGILFEVFLGAFGSYLFGDSVRIFGITTGTYLFFMGVGAFAIRSDHPRPLKTLLGIEFGLVLLHLLSPFAIWYSMTLGTAASPMFWAVLAISGTAVGTEIPLILALMREKKGSSDSSIHWVLASDYLGALAASLAFGFVLLPQLGLFAVAWSAALLGALGSVILAVTYSRRGPAVAACALLLMCLAAVLFSKQIQDRLESMWYSEISGETLVHHEWTGFADLALTQNSQQGLTLYLDRQFQWSIGRDLDYYHESLAVPAALAFEKLHARTPKSALILGGGDGFLADRLLRIFDLAAITIIDIDPRISSLALEVPEWRVAGGLALASPKVTVIHEDAYAWVAQNPSRRRGDFDLVFMDLPDPRNAALARFFTPLFFLQLSRIAPGATLAIQASAEVRKPGGARRHLCSLVNNLAATHAAAAAIEGKEQDGFVLGTLAAHGTRAADEKELLDPLLRPSQQALTTLTRARWFNSPERLMAWAEGKVAGTDNLETCADVPRHSLLRPALLDL
jgi:spermidine synthase